MVQNSSTLNLIAATRSISETTFAHMQTVDAGFLVGLGATRLVVDPDGAAVLTWVVGDKLRQAVRASAAVPFGSPTDIEDSGVSAYPYAPYGVSVASDASGRAVIVYHANGVYRVASRAAGGAFGEPVDLSGPVTQGTFFATAAAMAPDGSAAVIVSTQNTTATSCNLPVDGASIFQRTGVDGAWTPGATVGGTANLSVGFPALAWGGGHFEAAWTVDRGTDAQRCPDTGPQQDRPFAIQAGPLGPTLADVYSDTPAQRATGSPGSATFISFPVAMALDDCGNGALIFGVQLGYDPADANDGLYTSSMTGSGAPDCTQTTTTTVAPGTTTSTTVPCTTTRCTLDDGLNDPACAEDTIPAKVTTKLDKVVQLIDDAAGATPKKAKQLRKKAKGLLQRAGAAIRKAAKGKKATIGTECAARLQQAVTDVRAGLGG
ncbi:MAG TPA: hypothetical protein VGR62_26335 [Candidatus Binatia bacterium]|nr:hypothetical protein [Candidatus Binatia bacterium]